MKPFFPPAHSISPVTLVALVLGLGLAASCSPDFKSGETRCSLLGECPSGFVCGAGQICVTAGSGAPDAAAAGGKGGGSTGGGGAGSGGAGGGSASGGGPGTGGAVASGGAGGGGAGSGGAGGAMGKGGSSGQPDASPPPDGGPAACPDPKRPVPCPALLDAPAGCFPPDTDCSQIVRCFGEAQTTSCRVGYLSDCRFRNCIPAGACPTGSRLCPGKNYLDLGPFCLETGKDCTTVTICAGDPLPVACAPGMWYSCADKACLPVAAPCSKPELPQLCGARGGAPEQCTDPSASCNTLTMCPDKIEVGGPQETVSCQYINRVGPAGGKCPTPNHPIETKFCPAVGMVGPSCWRPNIDCATVSVCNGEPTACPVGTKVDCKYPNPCSPVADKCPYLGDPAETKFCPAAGGAGPDCYPPETDCASIVTCPDGSIGFCPAGKKYDCATDKCL